MGHLENDPQRADSQKVCMDCESAYCSCYSDYSGDRLFQAQMTTLCLLCLQTKICHVDPCGSIVKNHARHMKMTQLQ
jgi:hypothetical protein